MLGPSAEPAGIENRESSSQRLFRLNKQSLEKLKFAKIYDYAMPLIK